MSIFLYPTAVDLPSSYSDRYLKIIPESWVTVHMKDFFFRLKTLLVDLISEKILKLDFY